MMTNPDYSYLNTMTGKDGERFRGMTHHHVSRISDELEVGWHKASLSIKEVHHISLNSGGLVTVATGA